MTIGSSIGNLGNQSSGLNGLPASSNLGMPYDSQSSSVSSVSIPVTPSDVRASVNVAPTSTKQKKKWVHFIVMLSAHFKWGRGGGGSTCNLHLKGVIPGRIGIWTCWFLRRGENRSTRRKTSRGKGENQQQTQATYGVDAGIWTRATSVGGERSHHLATLAPLASL